MNIGSKIVLDAHADDSSFGVDLVQREQSVENTGDGERSFWKLPWALDICERWGNRTSLGVQSLIESDCSSCPQSLRSCYRPRMCIGRYKGDAKTKQIEETYCIRLSTGPAGNNGSKPPDELSLTRENKKLRARDDWQAQPMPRAGWTCAVTSSRYEKVPEAQQWGQLPVTGTPLHHLLALSSLPHLQLEAYLLRHRGTSSYSVPLLPASLSCSPFLVQSDTTTLLKC
uniref:Uncharacterized protein n=1 Tax=Timema shepardi TaxID=629360 RepID=A0A7R9G090_TIMSH|nr:unnamed protein product [Timema shepardi]